MKQTHRLAVAIALALGSAAATADNATITANGSIQAGCQFANAAFSISLPAISSPTLNSGGVVKKTGTLQVQCSSGVNGSVSLVGNALQSLDVNSSGSPQVEARLYSDTGCTNLMTSTPLTFTGTGSTQDLTVCVDVRRVFGATVPAGTIAVSWPVSLTFN